MGGGGRGGQKRGRTQRRHFRQPRENVWKRSKSDSPSDNPTWEPFATQNLAFEEYYKEQGIVSEEEWDVFMDVLRKPLPAAFRINSSGQFFGDIRSQLENDFMKSLKSETTDEGEVEAIRPLPWYPDNLAWHLNFSRMQLRKNQTLERFHQFLKQENEIGNITRQEAVSMVPPLFLDISPDHFVLDMCAAPGSKTFQLLEIIHQSSKRGSLPNGMIIANDADVQRCNLLIHQMKRMCTANLIVTNHEAQHFPGCRLSNDFYDANENGSVQEYGLRQLLFDRVLCDVPCSGDGTLRKAPDIWRKWNAGMGNGFHSLQVQIAMRGLSLLKVGGRMVYSTCSMNPVENEAVVAEILRRCGQSIELVDASGELPQLVRRPGHKKWKVRDKGIWFASYDDVPEYRRSVILPSMFPSGKSCETEKAMSDYFKENTAGGNGMEILPDMPERQGNVEQLDAEHRSGQFEKPETLDNALEKEVSGFPLERCMRILPHDQNSGAFFIAVLCKLLPLPAVAGYPINSHGRSTFHKDVPLQKVSDEIIEDTNGLEINPSGDDGVNHEHTEEAFDIDLQNKESEAVFNPDSCGKREEVKEQEAQVHGDGENGPKKGRGGKQSLQMQGRWRGVDPVVFFADSTSISSIKAFYGIDEYFPFDGNLVSRNSDCHHVKRIYYISNSVKDVLKRNFQVGQQLKITSIGLKMFERQTSKEGTASPCMFRISSEGLPLLLPYITKQILYASLPDFKHLLQYKTIKFADFVDPEFGDKASKLLLGCCVVVLKKGSCSPLSFITTDSSTLAIGGWRGRTNITAMVSAMDCQELLGRLSVCLGSQSNSLVRENKSVSADDTAQNSDDIELKHDLDALKEAPLV